MKRCGHIMERVVAFDNMMHAFFKAQRGKQCSAEVIRFREHLFENIERLRQSVIEERVALGRYRKFTIYDPKKRTICAAHFEERVLHHAIMDVCHPVFERHLISDTYASRLGKGTYAALDRARQGFNGYRYVAKLDVRSYFDSIDHAILMTQLRRLFKDDALLRLFERIVDSYQASEGRGLPIGNLTSQYFANHYLSVLDHYIKECLGVPLYVRYMDDMLLFADSIEVLRRQVSAVATFAMERLHLTLKPPIFHSVEQPTVFLGYRLSHHVITLSRRSRRRFAARLRCYWLLYSNGRIDEAHFVAHLQPLLAFTYHAYSKRFLRTTIRKVENCMPLTV